MLCLPGLQRVQTNWCGHQKACMQKTSRGEKMKNQRTEKFGSGKRGLKEGREKRKHKRALALSGPPCDPFVHSIWESFCELSHSTDSEGQRAVQKLNGLRVIPIREETGQKAPHWNPIWKIELCGKTRGEIGVFACRWIKHHFIWGAASRLYDKCNPFISHSSEADPLHSFI